MEYREAIQKLAADVDAVYQKAGALRDYASPDEKQYWNYLRQFTRDAYDTLNRLDNNLSDSRAQMNIRPLLSSSLK
jgi:hypothetical protein